MKSKFKAPGTQRLKLKYNHLLLNFALKFNLRRSIEDVYFGEALRGERSELDGYDLVAGAYTRSPFSPLSAFCGIGGACRGCLGGV